MAFNTMNKNPEDYSTNSEKIRINKAKIILSREDSIQKIEDGLYLVQSQTGIGWYKIDCRTDEWKCNCPDFIKNGHIRPCKHIVALKMKFLGKDVEDYKYAESPKVTYDQSWADYNLAQIQEFELFDLFLSQLLSTIEESGDDGPGRPKIKRRDKIFCCIMKIYSQLSSRRASHIYHEALQRQQIQHAPHFNVVSNTLNEEEIKPILHELVHLSAQPLSSIETDFAVDSSGFRCSSFGAYFEEKHHVKRSRNWLKVHISTGVSTNIVADVVITDEYGADSPQFEKLINNTAKHFNIEEVSADMAYLSRKNLEIVDDVGGRVYIPFKKNSRGLSRGCALWSKAFYYFQLHKDEFMDHYHKRSNVESTFAAIKKKFGESVKSKNRLAQENEILCKIIAYNITVLIHEMIQLNGASDFLSFNGLQKEKNM